MSIRRSWWFAAARPWPVARLLWPALALGLALAVRRALVPREAAMPRLPVRRRSAEPRSSRLRRLQQPAPAVVLPSEFWDASHSAALVVRGT